MQSCMKPSETIEMKMAGFFVNLLFVHQREGLLSVSTLILFNHNKIVVTNESVHF